MNWVAQSAAGVRRSCGGTTSRRIPGRTGVPVTAPTITSRELRTWNSRQDRSPNRQCWPLNVKTQPFTLATVWDSHPRGTSTSLVDGPNVHGTGFSMESPLKCSVLLPCKLGISRDSGEN